MDSREYLIELRTSTGMTRREFCEYFEIPYRTLQDWELGNRKMPDYLLRLMAYKAKMEKLAEEKIDILTICCFTTYYNINGKRNTIVRNHFYDTADGKCPVQGFFRLSGT